MSQNPYLKRSLISPPFGNYFSHSEATRVRGSFTVERRKGLIWNTLKTFRKVEGGWINNIGLRNCGVQNVKVDPKSIYSLAAIESDDWARLYDGLNSAIDMVEINISCPTVATAPIPSNHMFDLFHLVYKVVIVKIANSNAGWKQAMHLVDECGVKIIHACNTVPTKQGGISGGLAKPTAQQMVEQLRNRYADLTIIGGGGIYSKHDIDMYESYGADHFSLSTAFMCPLRARRLISYAAHK